MSILELCLSPDLGGLELYMLGCCRNLPEKENVIAIISDGSRLQDYVVKENISHRLLSRQNKALPFISAYKLARMIDDTSADVLHIHWGKDLPLAAFAKALSRRKPKLIYTRQMMMTRMKQDFYHRFLYRQMDIMITITKMLAERVKGLLPDEDASKVMPLYYGVKPPESFITEEQRLAQRQKWDVEDDEVLFAVFGRLKRYKGQHLMIEAFSNVVKQGANAKLLIVGHAMKSDYPDKLKALALELGVQDKVIFEGFTDTPQAWMQTCDCVALTTIEETFGLVLPEAMRSKVAVIGSDRGGVPEIIEHKKTGLLFESGNVDSLTQQLQFMLDNPNKRKEMALAGEVYAKEMFDVKSHYLKLVELFKQESDS